MKSIVKAIAVSSVMVITATSAYAHVGVQQEHMGKGHDIISGAHYESIEQVIIDQPNLRPKTGEIDYHRGSR